MSKMIISKEQQASIEQWEQQEITKLVLGMLKIKADEITAELMSGCFIDKNSSEATAMATVGAIAWAEGADYILKHEYDEFYEEVDNE